jgi:hypothetical protein
LNALKTFEARVPGMFAFAHDAPFALRRERETALRKISGFDGNVAYWPIATYCAAPRPRSLL